MSRRDSEPKDIFKIASKPLSEAKASDARHFGVFDMTLEDRLRLFRQKQQYVDNEQEDSLKPTLAELLPAEVAQRFKSPKAVLDAMTDELILPPADETTLPLAAPLSAEPEAHDIRTHPIVGDFPLATVTAETSDTAVYGTPQAWREAVSPSSMSLESSSRAEQLPEAVLPLASDNDACVKLEIEEDTIALPISAPWYRRAKIGHKRTQLVVAALGLLTVLALLFAWLRMTPEHRVPAQTARPATPSNARMALSTGKSSAERDVPTTQGAAAAHAPLPIAPAVREHQTPRVSTSAASSSGEERAPTTAKQRAGETNTRRPASSGKSTPARQPRRSSEGVTPEKVISQSPDF